MTENFWKNKRVVVTGGAGFLGSFLTEKLVDLAAADILVPCIEHYDLTDRDDIHKLLDDVSLSFENRPAHLKPGNLPEFKPQPTDPQDMIIIPVEALIEITAEGAVLMDGMRFSRDDQNLSDLVTQLQGLKGIADSQKSPFYVNILPNQDSMHERVIDVMDACAAAGVKSLSFSKAM